MATLTTERTTIERPTTEQITAPEPLVMDAPDAVALEEGTVSRSSRMSARLTRWGDKFADYKLSTGYYRLFII